MGEIKSTLDLVMEKTRNLKLSDEEKRQQKDKEIGSRIRGLLNKFQDKAISLDHFKSEYRALKKEYSQSEEKNEYLIEEICDQIEPDGDNQPLFDLLAEFEVHEVEGLRSILQEFQKVSETAARERRKILKDRLAKSHYVSGSAVVPNLENDAQWRKESAKLRAKYRALLDEEKTKLLSE